MIAVPTLIVPDATESVKAVIVEFPPTQTAEGTAVAVTTGKAVGVTTTVAVVEQPPPVAVKV